MCVYTIQTWCIVHLHAEIPSPCANLTCLNGGNCTDTGGVAICHCDAEWYGDNCEKGNNQTTTLKTSKHATKHPYNVYLLLCLFVHIPIPRSFVLVLRSLQYQPV